MPKTRARAGVRAPSHARAQGGPQVEADALWPVAMLRIAMELKRPGSAGIDAIVEGVVSRMGIPQEPFRRFLVEHLGTLQELARSTGDEG
jgi:hypothetical protein